MSKKKKYNINTFWLCAMLAFMVILFLFLYTDYKVWDKQYRNAGQAIANIEFAPRKVYDPNGEINKTYRSVNTFDLNDLVDYYSAGEAIRDNWHIYLLTIVIAALMEYGIICIRRKKYDPGQSDQLMSSTLVTGFSHELKTPLAVIRALVENWDYIDEADHEKYTERFAEEVEHMDKLVNRLENLSELKSGVIKLKKTDVDLYSLTEEIYAQLKYMIEERQLNVSITADSPEKCKVKGDPEMLKIAVANFFSNAVKNSEHEVKVELIAGKKVLFRIANDGNVLDKEEATKVWDLFYKNDTARTNRLGSSGVGLTVTKSILKAHKAKFGCIPKEKETVFWFEMKSI